MTTILGIETSCDETAAAVVADGTRVASNVVASQIELHRKYGGVVPEIASRAHIERLDSVIDEALQTAGVTPDGIDAIAVTTHPGLIGSLLIGVTAAKTLSWAWGKPLVGVNHVMAHAISPAIDQTVSFPAVALVVSGGHSSLYWVERFTQMRLIGKTTDDAAGEAFDKVASILGLSYPGGPAIQKAGEAGRADAVTFPRTMLARQSLDFSFSGIKTAVLYHVNGPGKTSGGLERLDPANIADIAASFQEAVVEVLIEKTRRAIEQTAARTVLVGGGVAANRRLRTRLAAICDQAGVALHIAAMPYCVDNGAMIAAAGYYLYQEGQTAGLDLAARAS